MGFIEAAKLMERKSAEACSGMRWHAAACHRMPGQGIPNQTKPYQTKPYQTNADGAEPEEASAAALVIPLAFRGKRTVDKLILNIN